MADLVPPGATSDGMGAPVAASALPALVAAAGERAGMRFLEFFAAAIRNPHTRRAYSQAVSAFLAWCETVGVPSLVAVQPLHVAAWIELQACKHSAPTAKQRLAALRHLFDWLVTGQVIPANPASAVRGPRHSALKGKTPVLDIETDSRQHRCSGRRRRSPRGGVDRNSCGDGGMDTGLPQAAAIGWSGSIGGACTTRFRPPCLAA
jgi:hypothetical protein